MLVGVESPAHVQQLVRTAGDLARPRGAAVRVVTVTVKGADSPFSVFSDETILREFAGESHELLESVTTPREVRLERDVLVARSPARGLLAAVEETDPSALVVGWEEGSPTDAVLGSTVDRLVERAPCDLYVEQVGREADGVESVLLAVAGGPHVDTAARAAAAIAAGNDARVVVFSVDAGGGGRPGSGDAETFVLEGRAAVAAADGPDVPTVTVVRESDDVTGTVVAEAADHDVVVLSATRRGGLRRRLAGSVPRRVAARTDRTVILARSGDVVGGPLGVLRRLIRR